MDVIEWLQSSLPGLGVSVVFIMAWWFERQDKIHLRDQFIRYLGRKAGLSVDDELNGD